MSSDKELDSLFAEFPQISKQEWIDKVNVDLKGADFNKKLVWKTHEGFSVDPFYMKSDLSDLSYLKNFHNINLNQSDHTESPRLWINFEKIDGSKAIKANKLANESLRIGADGINFMITKDNKIQLEKLLEGLDPNLNPVMFSIHKNHDLILSSFLDFLRKKESDNNRIKGFMDFDPIRDFSLTGELDKNVFLRLSKEISAIKDSPNFKLFSIHGDHFVNAGANTSLELGLLLSVAVSYLDQLTDNGCKPKEIVNSLFFYLGTGTNYFMEIAKIKALRILFHHIAGQYDIPDLKPGFLPIHATTSLWTKTLYDPYVNMLRNTTEAMSAILGGCNSISISPFDQVFATPTNFSRRISRNISSLLKEESHFDKVADPVAGSYYIEILTDQLVEKSLGIFKSIEKEGGYIKSFKNGTIIKLIDDSKQQKLIAIRNRRESIIGTNQYPNTRENIEEIELFTAKSTRLHRPVISELRASGEFESIRLATDKYSRLHGKRPKVFLSVIGENIIMRKARASFSIGFFGCAGYDVVESTPSPDIFKAVEKAIMSKSDIVVICGSDDDYVSDGADYARAFKANYQSQLVVAGSPENIKDLKEAGVDEFINIRTNLIEMLQNFQIKLNIN